MRKLPPLAPLAPSRRCFGPLWLFLGMLAWPCGLLSAQAPGDAACEPSFVRAYRELLALELGAQVEQAASLTLHCEATSAHVRLLYGRQVLERSVPLATADAARWLALAAGELLRTPPPVASPATPVQTAALPDAPAERTWRLYAAARVRLGDRPLTLRTGLELGGVAALRSWLALELALRFSSGAHAGLGPVRVRARDGGGALYVHYAYARSRLRVLTGVGWTFGYTALRAESTDPSVAVRSVKGAFTGPALALRALVVMSPRLLLLGGSEAAYLTPRIDGRDGSGDSLFRQQSWSLAFTLGVCVSL